MITVLVSMSIFALIGAISPGPVNIIAASSGANYGFSKTLPHVLGATIAYALIVLLMGTSLSQTLKSYPNIIVILKYLGGAFLLYMSYKIATAEPFDSAEITKETKPPTLVEGFLSQSLNPKAWLVSMSGVSLFVLPNSPASDYILAFTAISFVICFVGVGTWAAIGQLIGKFLSTRKRQVIFNVFMGGLLATTVVSIFIS